MSGSCRQGVEYGSSSCSRHLGLNSSTEGPPTPPQNRAPPEKVLRRNVQSPRAGWETEQAERGPPRVCRLCPPGLRAPVSSSYKCAALWAGHGLSAHCPGAAGGGGVQLTESESRTTPLRKARLGQGEGKQRQPQRRQRARRSLPSGQR